MSNKKRKSGSAKPARKAPRTSKAPKSRGAAAARSSPPIPNVDDAGPEHDVEEREQLEREAQLYVVGIGASAGGIEATGAMLRALPPDTGMAFVVVQHLDPTHASLLPEILGRATSMRVRTVEDGVAVEANQVYVIPPNRNMTLSRGALRLAPRTESAGLHRPIDHFLRSLAEEQGHKAIGVILSGTSNDGALGLVELKAAGGITFAQDGTAEQPSMPRSAVASGCVDFVLPPDEIAREIGRISRHPLVAAASEAELERARSEPIVARILEQVRATTNVDFSHYKRNTLHRRITRRMVLHKLGNLEDYHRLLQTNAAEVQALYEDVLINVTSFFRNPEAYEALKTIVFPSLCEDRGRSNPVRIWTVGCSTGEEAYSLAMAFTEYTESSGKRVALQVFASDLNGTGIEKARTGVYPRGISQDVSPARLRRFFVEVDGSYRIAKPIRDMCVFARQNVLADPPFSRMDLIACRNVLIYLEPALQQRLIPILHYALRNTSYLWLGSSETIGSYRDLFTLENPKHKIYSRKPSVRHAAVATLSPTVAQLALRKAAHSDPAREVVAPVLDPQREADRLVLTRYAPAGVLVDQDLNIIQFRGDTSPYLVPAPGRASLNLLKMLREGLLVGVRGAVHRARREETTVREEGLRVRMGVATREVDVAVVPVPTGSGATATLVLFEESAHAVRARSRDADAFQARAEAAEVEVAESRGANRKQRELERAEQELAATRDYLQSVIEQQEAANEELQSANEEVQSTNEELQSINEELETSKEEIQSSNEELATVNDELHNRNLELSESNDDLSNLLASVQLPIVMLGQDLRIRRYTPAAEKLLNLIPGDLGRPIADVKLNLTGAGDVERLLLDSIDRVAQEEREVQDKNGHWYLLRVRPYRTADNRIDGAVMVFVDTDVLKRNESELRESEARFETLADTAPVLIWVNDLEGCRFVNRAFEDFAGLSESELQGLSWTNVLHVGDRGQFMSAYLDALSRRATFEHQCRFRRADGEYRWMKTVATPRFLATREFVGYVGCSLDVTEMKHAEAAWLEMDRRKNEFLATLAHELRNPLAAVKNASYLLTRAAGDPQAIRRAGDVIERQTRNMVRLVDDLLDVSRLTHGKIQLQSEPLDLNAVLRQAIDANELERNAARQEIEVELPDPPVWVRADATRLDQVFTNLLDNASKFTPDGGRIWLSARREGEGSDERVAVRVRDSGVGIEPAMLGRIFDLFVQGERQAQSAQVGMGLGLTLAKRLVEWHGGSIEATSEGLGRGAEFVVRLPILDERDLPEEPVDAKPARVGRDAHRVLVVDDNPDAGETLSALLSSNGLEVMLARDGAEALRIAEAERPDVVLLDIGMPDMDGYSVARALRDRPATRDATIVAVTGYGRREDHEKSRAAGIDKHMTKPVRIELLLEVIAGAPFLP